MQGWLQLAAVGNTIPVALDGAFKLNQLGIPAVAWGYLGSPGLRMLLIWGRRMWF